MPYEPPPYLASLTLAEIAELVAQRKLPPVEGWAPQKVGDSFMRIAAAFAGLLTRDAAGQHWLVTPFEKLSIEVDDAAFVAVDCARADDALAFRLNTDDLVIAGPQHPLRAAGSPDNPAIYLHVRRGCEARLNRSTWGQLVDLALAEGGEANGWRIASQGAEFALLP
jgi:uncharacterized protein